MKRLAKILAIVLLVVIIGSVIRSVFQIKAASPDDSCPVLGNNLISNLSTEVLVNLRGGFRAAGGSDSCVLVETFLFRTPDFDNKELLNKFFLAAEANNIKVIVRVASDGYNDRNGLTHWLPIDVERARADADALNGAISAANLPPRLRPIAVFGNEVNFPVEWGDIQDLNQRATEYADSLIAFALAAKNFDVVMAPLSYADPNAQEFYEVVFKTIKGNGTCNNALNFIKNYIYGFGMNLYTHQKSLDPQGIDDLKNDFTKGVGYLANAWKQTGCSGESPIASTHFVITEFGIQDGTYIKGMQDFLLNAYKELLRIPGYGSRIAAVTSFNWENTKKNTNVHAFYYTSSGNGEYDPAKINLGGATAGGVSFDPGGEDRAKDPSYVPKYPPLGSLEICPPEVLVDSKMNNAIPTNTTSSCGITSKPEPKYCQDPALIDQDGVRDEWCSGDEPLHRLCYPESLNVFKSKGGYDCGGGADKTGNYARAINGFCLGQADDGQNNPIYQQWQKVYQGMQNGACVPLSDLAPKDQSMFGYCLGYYQKLGKTPNNAQTARENSQGLPACVPTYNAKARCVTECGQPISMGEALQIIPQENCLRSGDCLAQINIRNKDDQGFFFLPFAASLGDYFTGILDAEHQSAESLDALQNDLRDKLKSQEATDKLFDQAGVIRKLMPEEIQDKLKCDFVKYVSDKKNSVSNTKYVEKKAGVTIPNGKEFMIFDKKITDIKCPPDRMDAPAYNAWANTYAGYWFAVPLFPNDDSQGEIQFVSPSIFSTGRGSVKVSIPEVQRLASATGLIQQALIPEGNIELRNSLITSADPKVLQTYLPTYGKEIDPSAYINACTSKKWEDFYDANNKVVYDSTKNYRVDGGAYQLDPKLDFPIEGLTEYQRAVGCEITTLPGTDGSKICTVGPFGELRCSEQDKLGGTLTAGPYNPKVEVQVRTSFPYLFDIAEQTISKSTGVLRLFKPEAAEQGMEDEFEKAFDPIPASIDNVFYYLPSSLGLSIDDSDHKDSGWKLYFYKLGGLWQARNFVLDLLNPLAGSGGGPGGR